MGRRTVVEVGVALLAGALLGVGAHLWLGPAGASTVPIASTVDVAGATMERTGVVPDGVVAAATAGVLEVHASGCGGDRQASATFVRDGSGRELLLTNAHVVRGAASVRVVLADGSDAELAVLGAVDGKDAALLDPSPLRGAATAAALGPSVGLGDPVVVAGHPAGSFRLDASDVVDVQRRAAYGSASDVLLVGAAAEGGHSGGAVMDAAGAVVGLVAARDPGTGRVVAYRIDELLKATLGAPPGC